MSKYLPVTDKYTISKVNKPNTIPIQSEQKTGVKDKKYTDDTKYESFADNNIFYPIAEKLVDPLYCMGLTPNVVTIISTCFTFLSTYFLKENRNFMAMGSYLLGYTLDCVDGKMARKYSLTSDIGMALDMVSDNISNIYTIIFILYYYKLDKRNIVFLMIIGLMSYMLSLSYGLGEAISSYDATGSDNFYERKMKQLENGEKGKNTFEKLLYKLYLFIIKTIYISYRKEFPVYNEEMINQKLETLKEFGPGNYCIMFSLMILFLHRERK
jgi:phosphatidylglycerophosphate synthase